MAGNREVYLQHMEVGYNAAWDHNWSAAIKAYTQAIQEIKEDPEAHLHLGLALLKAGRLDDSLRVYKKAHQLSPDDATPLERSADVLERMGRLKEAAEQYINVADIYLGQRDLDKAISNWERATQLTPGLLTIHAKLAQAYERIGDDKRAVQEYLKLAFNFRRVNETDKAIRAVERALRIDPKNAQSLNTLAALKRGGEVILPEEIQEAAANKQSDEPINIFDLVEDDGQGTALGKADSRGPMGEAMSLALVNLAAYVVEGGILDASGGDALQAMEFQRQELYDEAIEAYLRAEPRLRHATLKLNLGVLLLMRDRPQDAVKHLGEAILDPELSAGAFHALGQAYYKLGQNRKAARYLIQSLQAVDTSLAVNDDEIAGLQAVYDRLISTLDEIDDETLVSINARFSNLLQGGDWKQRIADTRRHLEEAMRMEGDAAIRDIIANEGDKIAESVSLIDQYIRQNLLTLAMDEAHRAIEHSPYYLPVHVRMAEIMMRERRVRQGIQKYNTVANAYLVRGENDRAASILSEALEMAPLDIHVRVDYIKLLEQESRWIEALEQYIELAKTYHQLGDFDAALETYSDAEELARRETAPTDTIVNIKHNKVELWQTRLETRRARKELEEIVQLDGENERALKLLVDMDFTQNDSVTGVKRLDVLMGVFAKRKQINRITQVLEELVQHYQNDMGLRARLGAIYRRLNRKAEAIEQLDALGELQLEAGLHTDAANTIRQIIALQPDHVEDYKRLLSQLGG